MTKEQAERLTDSLTELIVAIVRSESSPDLTESIVVFKTRDELISVLESINYSLHS